jgi:hypothetical protein
LRKFGIPADAAPAKPEPPPTQNPIQNKDAAAEEPDTPAQPLPATPEIDKRPVQFLKAKLVSVDCSQPPAAVLLVSEGKKTMKLRTPDYKSLAVIGSAGFSCGWKDLDVNVNYRAGGKLSGDLISIEIQ